MQIYGNCTAVHSLGRSRIKGPVDNVVTKGVAFLRELLHGDYLAYFDKHVPKITSREPSLTGDHTSEYNYPIVVVSHNDPRTEKSKKELASRLDTFKEFKTKVLTDPDYYFIYSINQFDLNKQSHEIDLRIFEENIKYLKQEQLLDKIVFVETKNDNPKLFWNFYAINVNDTIKKYNLKYIQMHNITGGVDNGDILVPQFYKKASEAIVNWKEHKNEKSSNN